tara:strand:+ start:41535 stop:42212 length:678 start_codon:yes stop_codon:yes gene_type:complete
LAQAAARDSGPEVFEVFTPRQNAVLESALHLLVEGGDRALTTAGIARAANCSKESLYKWFGDRDGVLAAVVGYQASKVRVLGPGEMPGSLSSFRDHLTRFADDLLAVLSGEASLALNRLAIGQASRADAKLGHLVLERGRRMIELRAGALLETGRRRGFLAYDDANEAYRTLYGLIIGDFHVRQLLGDELSSQEKDFQARAHVAIGQFFKLYGTGTTAHATNARS